MLQFVTNLMRIVIRILFHNKWVYDHAFLTLEYKDGTEKRAIEIWRTKDSVFKRVKVVDPKFLWICSTGLSPMFGFYELRMISDNELHDFFTIKDYDIDELNEKVRYRIKNHISV